MDNNDTNENGNENGNGNENENEDDGLVVAQNLVDQLYHDIFSPATWILQDNIPPPLQNNNSAENITPQEDENATAAGGENSVDNTNLNDFDVVDDTEEVFTEELPTIPPSNIVAALQNSDTDNDVLLSDIDSESDNHLENTIVDDCCICYKPCNALNIVNTPCKHIYCTDCFYRWIRVRPTCPMCRRNFTSFSAMSNDEIANDVHNVTQIYRRNIIENQTLIDENRKLTKIILKRTKKNNELKIKTTDLMNRLIRVREQIDFTQGYNEGIKIKMKKEMYDKLNLFASEFSYFNNVLDVYKSIPYHKGLKSGLLEYHSFNRRKYDEDTNTTFSQYKKKNFKKADKTILKQRRNVNV
tara:strand:- start:2155 stop:3222 length:1068 start_codon:yes stop_codon:yes gene_type:complete